MVVIKIFFDFFELKKWREQNGWLLFNFDFSGCCFSFVSIWTGWKFCVMNFAFMFWMAKKIEEWIDSMVVFVCVILFVFLFMGNLVWNIFLGKWFLVLVDLLCLVCQIDLGDHLVWRNKILSCLSVWVVELDCRFGVVYVVSFGNRWPVLCWNIFLWWLF